MGQISVEIMRLPGSVLSGNQHMGDIESRNPDGPGRMIASLLSSRVFPGRGAPRKWP